MKDKNINKLKINKQGYILVFFLFMIFCLSLTYRCLVDYPAKGKMTISQFTQNRNINEEVLLPERGPIYDIKGNVLAQDVSSYTLIAYLDEERSKDSKVLRHVKDKEKTALILSKYIDTPYERILQILNKDAYQVEFGPGGRNLSQLKMEEIKALNLPAIDFIKSTKRYYPNGDFASYLLGYTKDKKIGKNNYQVGELGIEGYFNKELTGKAGYIKYEKDGRGNKIANSNEYIKNAVNGSSIYLTVDESVQLFIERAVKKVQSQSKAEWVLMAIMDAKTGAILGYSSTPSFDPNIRNITNYMDPLVSYTYEPGSTMKTFSYMCAINSGKYDGQAKFKSGYKTYVSKLDEKDKVTIKDWNNLGWGNITYDFGFAISSNIGVANLVEKVIGKSELRKCYRRFGFGKETGISLNNEQTGDIDFEYDVEAATAGYGQGITVSPIQILQGLSIISNDGVMLRPYVVDKIISDKGKVLLENKRKELGQVVTHETVDKMKELLRSVITPDAKKGTGYAYYMKGYDLIGKTGTASIYENGKYLEGYGEYIYSFEGLYPGKDPEIVIYMALKKPQDTYNYMAPVVKETLINVSKYMNISPGVNKDRGYVVENYLDKKTANIHQELKNKKLRVITLGKGEKIISQYPQVGSRIYQGDLVILLTDNYDRIMVDLKGLSYKECKSVLDMMRVKYHLSGYGYVDSQSIEAGKKVNDKVEVHLKNIYNLNS